MSQVLSSAQDIHQSTQIPAFLAFSYYGQGRTIKKFREICSLVHILLTEVKRKNKARERNMRCQQVGKGRNSR